ncbi:hypothetical protein BKA56DRAFT_612929 [Ilyonectria sp. MPI-CAGE-AT-0026]|nr:hypothetical protein BKA56DRAFT_612929 [Ilyonectria sp. MPI-CAGE-AT-0026]
MSDPKSTNVMRLKRRVSPRTATLDTTNQAPVLPKIPTFAPLQSTPPSPPPAPLQIAPVQTAPPPAPPLDEPPVDAPLFNAPPSIAPLSTAPPSTPQLQAPIGDPKSLCALAVALACVNVAGLYASQSRCSPDQWNVCQVLLMVSTILCFVVAIRSLVAGFLPPSPPFRNRVQQC